MPPHRASPSTTVFDDPAGLGVSNGSPSGRDEARLIGPAEHGQVGPVERFVDAAAAALGRVPRWLLPVNVAAVTILAWWAAFGLEQATGGTHLGSTLTLVFGVVLTVAVTVFVKALEQIRQLQLRVEQAATDADVDPLTGLMTRKAIAADIQRRLDDQRVECLIGVLFCDLDRLKVVNDSLGHEAGDKVLQVAAQRISRVLRSDDSIGRFAGDKFVIVTSGLRTPRDLELLADRLVTVLSQPTALTDASTQVISASVGIAWSVGEDGTGHYDVSADLLRDADSAMQVAKAEGGGNYAVFDSSVRARAVARLELEQDLRRGIAENELVVHYQPIVDVETGDAERYEALVRWNHPVRGMIHPADFLSVAAESSLIVDIGDRVLHRACHQAVRWTQMTGRPITVAVNVAERQLLDLGLVGSVTKALAESGLPPDQLELEITEELIMERLDRALLVLRQLELAGVKLVIDDFGTSQASLARLQSLAMVSTLKIDRIFVEGLANESVDRNIVTAIVSLASSIGMSIVAEGVEQADQAAVLRALGVRYQQGFLYQRPGPPEMMIRYLQRLQESPDVLDGESFDAAVAKAMFETSILDSPSGD
ncbi:MAG: EAL domain-containing protein [Acidimicrobiia bacterium]|nr:EAL domain-containing protein [Acidimicrobiia bacterium]